jgi:1,4-dihydroxy-2-naphthoate polyprenyltransferase
MSGDEIQSIHPVGAWLLAIRPKTLPAAASPVILASTLAFIDGMFDLLPSLAALLGALFLQIGSNLANDLYDFRRGADAGERLGPTRVTQAGILTPGQVRRGMIIVFGITVIIGVYLIWHAGWPILVIGIAAILSAIAYTGGPFPLGYHGLGDVFVFVFFGLAATAGTYFVQAGTVSLLAWCMGACMGLLIVAILVVNNLRDIESDRVAGKRTLAVRMGVKATRLEYLLCIVGAYLIPLTLWLLGALPLAGLFVYLSIPLAWRCLRSMYSQSGRELNRTLAATGLLSLVYALTFSLGLFLFTLW